jgi:aspartyl-tRNA(Asn)/glutamyl-tRNA(Gln) amidotransferase subunit C
MKLSLDEVKKISRLSGLELTPAEVSRFRTELSEVIDYSAHKLAQVKKRASVTPVASETLGQADEARPSLSQGDALANAPREDSGFIVVPKVLD